MLRLGLASLALSAGFIVLAIILTSVGLVTAGPCAGPGILFFYFAIPLFAGVGLLLVALALIGRLIRRLRAHSATPV